jgi:hypothetical protein
VEYLLLLRPVELEPAPGVPVASVPLEGAESAQESRLALQGLDRHHSIEEIGDARRAGAGKHLFRDIGEHRAAVVVEKARNVFPPARNLQGALEGRGMRRRDGGETGRKAAENVTAPNPRGGRAGIAVRCHGLGSEKARVL